jgi:hypothetical protein
MRNNVARIFFLLVLACCNSACIVPVETKPQDPVKAIDLPGTWRGTLCVEDSPTEMVAVLTAFSQQGNNFTGDAKIDGATYTMTGTIEQKKVTVLLKGNNSTVHVVATGELLQDDYIVGTWTDEGSFYIYYILFGTFAFIKDK